MTQEKYLEMYTQWCIETAYAKRCKEETAHEAEMVISGTPYNDAAEVGPFPTVFKELCSEAWARKRAQEAFAELPEEDREKIERVSIIYHYNDDSIEFLFSRNKKWTRYNPSNNGPVFVNTFMINRYYGYTDCLPEWVHVEQENY